MTDAALPSSVHGHRWSALRGTLMRVGFVLILAYVVLFGGGFGGTQVLSLRILNLGLTAFVLLAWAALSWHRPSWRPRTAIWPAIVIPLATLTLTTALSRYPRLGLEYLAWAVLLVALYLLLVRIMAVPSMREHMGEWAALLGFVIGIQYLAIVGAAWLDWWGLIGRVAMPMLRPAYAGLTLGGPTIVAPVMVLLTAAAFGGRRPTSLSRRLVLAMLAALMLVVVVLTGSRASWLALGVAVVLSGLALLVVYRSRISEILRDRRWRRLAMATALIIIPVAIVAAPAILARVGAPGDGGRGSYVAAGLRMFEDSPLLGIGTGTWASQRAAYTEPGEIDFYVNHAHNIYVQTLAEMGVVGALGGIIVVITVSWLVMRGLRAVDPSRRRWAWAAVFGLVYLACNSLLDYYANMPVVMLTAAIPIAVLDASSERLFGLPGLSPRADRVTRRIGQGVFWVACVLSLLVLWRTESIATSHDAAVASVRSGDWEAARSAAEVAATADPDMVPYVVTRAMAASALGDWQAALESYQKAALADDLPANWLGLAQAQAALGMRATDVTASIERSLRIGDRQPSVAYAAGWLFDRIGMTDRADELFAEVLVSFPSLAADESWTGDTTLARRFPTILDEAIEQAGPGGWQIALMTGDTERARSLAATGEGRTALPIELVIDAWTGDEDALAEVRSIVDARPDDLTALGWAARLSSRSGDEDGAIRYRRQARFVNDGGFVGAEVGVGGRGPQQLAVTGAHTDMYGQMLYRRALPADMIPPGLPRLVYLVP